MSTKLKERQGKRRLTTSRKYTQIILTYIRTKQKLQLILAYVPCV